MAGRPYALHSRRFAEAIPRKGGGVYLVEFGNGIVKVGESRQLRKRLIGLNQTCRQNGHEVKRFAVFIGGCDEQKCIDAITARARPYPGHVEYFEGIDYADALAAVLPVVDPVACLVVHGQPA